jgi:hypothetical protein
MHVLPDVLGGAEFVQGFVDYPEKTGLLRVGGDYPSATLQVPVEAVAEHFAQRRVGIV